MRSKTDDVFREVESILVNSSLLCCDIESGGCSLWQDFLDRISRCFLCHTGVCNHGLVYSQQLGTAKKYPQWFCFWEHATELHKSSRICAALNAPFPSPPAWAQLWKKSLCNFRSLHRQRSVGVRLSKGWAQLKQLYHSVKLIFERINVNMKKV